MAEPNPVLDIEEEGDVLVLTVRRQQFEGDEVAQSFKAEMEAALGRKRATRVILDLKNTRYVSSIVFWPLLALRRKLADCGGKLIICGLVGAVQDVFTTTKMVSTGGAVNAPFEVAPDRAAALSQLGVAIH
jgi:anti-anti-sigma factor